MFTKKHSNSRVVKELQNDIFDKEIFNYQSGHKFVEEQSKTS